MTNIVSIPPRGNNSNNYHSEGRALRFHSNFLLDIVKHYYFHWSNIVLSKFKKEEKQYIRIHYLSFSKKKIRDDIFELVDN